MGNLQAPLFGGIRQTQKDWLTEVTISREVQPLLADLLL